MNNKRNRTPLLPLFGSLGQSVLVWMLLTGTAHAAPTGLLNDTGITDCWNDTGVASGSVAADGGTHPRQDCRYGRDAAAAAGSLAKTGAGGKGFDFTKIANNGSVLPASAALGSGSGDWACTRDNVTGLIWEVKTYDGLSSRNNTYSWYNSNSATNGGNVGSASGGSCATEGRCDTEKFAADVNAADLCGASNWRMPTKQELISIVDYGFTEPAIDSNYFPNTFGPFSFLGRWEVLSIFWSANTLPSDSGVAWYVYFRTGSTGGYSKNTGFLVRLVRSGR